MLTISLLLTIIHRRQRHERYKELREYYHEQMTCVFLILIFPFSFFFWKNLLFSPPLSSRLYTVCVVPS